jgi:SnoaL-like protein
MSEPADLPAAIRAFVDATNAGDTDAFLATFSADPYLNDWGREFHGREGAASWNETDNIGVRAHFEVHGVRVENGAYVVTMKVSGGGFNGTGPLTFTLDDAGKIDRLVIS